MDITPNSRNDRADYNHGYCKDQCCVVHTNNVVIEIYISIKEISFMFHKEIFTSDYISFIRALALNLFQIDILSYVIRKFL